MTHFFRPSEAFDKSLVEVGDLICQKLRAGGKTYDRYLMLVDDNEENVINGNKYSYMKFVEVGPDKQVCRMQMENFLNGKNYYLVAKADKSAKVNL
jgi:hypothetical protein